jgi:hypothetical protein
MGGLHGRTYCNRALLGVAAGAFTLTLLAAGCGGKNAHERYTARADAICARVEAREQTLPRARSNATLAVSASSAGAAAARARAGLAALDPPAKDRRAHRRLVAALAKQAKLGPHVAAAARANRTSTAQRLVTRFATSDAHARRAALLLGLSTHGCAEAGGARSPRSSFAAVTGAPTAVCPLIMGIPSGDVQPAWSQLTAARQSVGTIVLNVYNGPGLYPSREAAQATRRAQLSGIRVIGYVFTRFGTRPEAQVESDIRVWKARYGVDGVFVDNVSEKPGKVSYYRRLARFIRSSPGRYVVLNAAGSTTPDYATIGDVDILFESTYRRFRSYSPPRWAAGVPADRLGTIVYDARGTQALDDALHIAQRGNFGYVYVTDGDGSSESVPSYFRREVKSTGGGC